MGLTDGACVGQLDHTPYGLGVWGMGTEPSGMELLVKMEYPVCKICTVLNVWKI